MKKKTIQSLTMFIPVSQLDATWNGQLDKLPANQTFDLIIDYPFGGEHEYHFPIKTGKRGLGLMGLLNKIGKAYAKIYNDPDKYQVFGHDIGDLQLEGIKVNFKTKRIRLSIGS